jgi:hypothetical protein
MNSKIPGYLRGDEAKNHSYQGVKSAFEVLFQFEHVSDKCIGGNYVCVCKNCSIQKLPGLVHKVWGFTKYDIALLICNLYVNSHIQYIENEFRYEVQQLQVHVVGEGT